jgi:hypothetical protein
MSHFQCPVCGKHSSIRLYEPEGFDDDIELISYSGLGRGKGFESYLAGYIDDDPELKERLRNRVQRVLEILSEE